MGERVRGSEGGDGVETWEDEQSSPPQMTAGLAFARPPPQPHCAIATIRPITHRSGGTHDTGWNGERVRMCVAVCWERCEP